MSELRFRDRLPDNRSRSFDLAVSVQTNALRPWAVDVDHLRLHTPSHHGGACQAGDLSRCYSRCYRRPSCTLRTQRCNCPICTLSNVHGFGRLVTRRSPEHFVKGECRGFRSVHKIWRHNCSIWYLIKDGPSDVGVANTSTAAMGGTYAFVSTASANLRQKNDAYNPGLGGFFAGALVGLRSM